MKTAAIVALVAVSGTDAKFSGTIGNTTLYGNTEKNGNVTNGTYTINGTTKKNKTIEYSKKYVVIGNKSQKKNRTSAVETIMKFDKYFFYAIQTKNQDINGGL